MSKNPKVWKELGRANAFDMNVDQLVDLYLDWKNKWIYSATKEESEFANEMKNAVEKLISTRVVESHTERKEKTAIEHLI